MLQENISAGIFVSPPLILVQAGDMPTVRPDDYRGFAYDHKFDIPTQLAIATNMEQMESMREENLPQIVARLFVYSTNLGSISPAEMEIAKGVLQAIENITLAEFVAQTLGTTLPLSTDSQTSANFRRALLGMHIKEVPARVSIFVDSGFNAWEEKIR